VDLDYRRRFISLLKMILGEEEFAVENPRPYTFAVYFGREAKIKNGVFTNVREINFRFSTGDTTRAIKFYNGVLRLKKGNHIHEIGTGKFFISWIKEEKEKQPTGVFKTLSPVIVERIGFSNLKDPTDRYTVPWEEGFEESLWENILRRFRAITGRDLNLSFLKFEPISVKEEVIRHYGGTLRGFLGRFRIMSDSEELLRFIYQYGLGLRTGQGFGYLEVEDGEADL